MNASEGAVARANGHLFVVNAAGESTRQDLDQGGLDSEAMPDLERPLPHQEATGDPQKACRDR
jgi:hypothetical protein